MEQVVNARCVVKRLVCATGAGEATVGGEFGPRRRGAGREDRCTGVSGPTGCEVPAGRFAKGKHAKGESVRGDVEGFSRG